MEQISITMPKWPIADEKEWNAVRSVLESDSWWRNTGTQVKLFEKEFAKYQGCKSGLALSNGTVSIEIALKALNIGCGDEVIVPDFTFYSTVSAVLAVGAIPVLVDVSKDDFCIDLNEIEKAITSKTKAIIPVHIAGHMADMYGINDIAKRYNLYVIEDCAHAQGAALLSKRAGLFGTLSTFSFQNAKLMTAGEGGIILGNDQSIMDRVLLEANCGRAEGDTNYQHVLVGTNARLSEIQGAILRIQLERFEEHKKLRDLNYEYISKKLQTIPGITLQKVSDSVTEHSHYMVMFYFDSSSFGGATRDEFVEYLKQCNIPANRAYKAIHEIPLFQALDHDKWKMSDISNYKNSIAISDNVVCLAHNILLGDEKLLDQIINCIINFQKNSWR